MRKFSLVCLFLSVILSLGLLASAPASFAECQQGDHVYYGQASLGVQYSQQIEGVWDDWAISGSAQSDGSMVTGRINARSNGDYGSFNGAVTCFFRCDNIAWFSGPAKYTHNESGKNLTGYVIIVQDNGEPGVGSDEIQLRVLEEIPWDTYCSEIPGDPFYSGSVIYRGNLIVNE